ncbi:hypothetical protein HRR83_000528 [Exophiala dermatitidis]|uniref:Aminoglycoside phosphotransferase domain-containing protein n=1 Tax=Exophiala dermatitidis TaxID=5970 RepID=A0AAN6J2V5_EXODE|nr:hypothetical protein HRR74_000529 [Exophiala dermatitidis]KAJ4528410.1 hypothetical protein HRR73_001033 [Exophiala dermatitidis]KAJ4531367.1 hypothetical protein HRR76_009027 [Exophiala dermatitidis]KAJ4558529.1 hypothetical protein HRR77_000529 [Exophiala dermatitidis]KAJ4581437.1 hypothetical protein HRR79_000468 [Exophiala dermatitidis]
MGRYWNQFRFLPSLFSSVVGRAGSCLRLRKHRPQSCPTPFIPVPYYVPTIALPAPLPSIVEIEASTEILRERSTVKVVAIGSHYVVKYGETLNLEEGRMMVFIAQHTQIPVPRVYALFRDGKDRSFIVMERIHGQTLKETWHTFADHKKELIVMQLRHCIRQLRKVGSPGGYCGLDQKPLLDDIFWTPEQDCNGPFDTEADLNAAIVRKCRTSEALKHKAEFYNLVFPEVLVGHQPVLTHGDLQKKNIMIRTGDENQVVILDWEVAGWYPTYWEYASTIFAAWFEDDWYRWIPQFLETFPNEYAWYAMVAQEIA